ncbi:MAG: hypothetical protein ABI877_21925, partial [Gemmatimonadaceae bacterium]
MEFANAALLDASPDVLEDELTRLQSRLDDVSRERDQLLAVVDILQEISSTLHFSEILQRIARKLGDMFGLDRCSIYLVG